MFSLGRINTYNTPAKHSYKYGLGITGRGRKKGSVHPGHLCGPCHLCQQSSTRYSHIITWDEEVKMQMKQLSGVCENDVYVGLVRETSRATGLQRATHTGGCTTRGRVPG